MRINYSVVTLQTKPSVVMQGEKGKQKFTCILVISKTLTHWIYFGNYPLFIFFILVF